MTGGKHVHLTIFDMGSIGIYWHKADDDAGWYNVEECYLDDHFLLGHVACHPVATQEGLPYRAYRMVGDAGILNLSPRQQKDSPLGIRIGGWGKQRFYYHVDEYGGTKPQQDRKRSRGQFRDADEAKLALVRSAFHFWKLPNSRLRAAYEKDQRERFLYAANERKTDDLS